MNGHETYCLLKGGAGVEWLQRFLKRYGSLSQILFLVK